MLEELTEEMLDLTVNVRGYGSAVYAVSDDGSCGNCCSLCCSVVLCCCCCDLCW